MRTFSSADASVSSADSDVWTTVAILPRGGERYRDGSRSAWVGGD